MKKLLVSLAVVSTAVFVSSCNRNPVQHQDWAPEVRTALNDFIRMYGNQPEKGYAVFDFDNTSAIFDISEQLIMYQLETMSFNLTPEAFAATLVQDIPGCPAEIRQRMERMAQLYDTLYSKYGPFTCEGSDGTQFQGDDVWKEFAVLMAGMYEELQKYMSIDDAYIWVLAWFSGMDEKQLYDLSYRSHKIHSEIQTEEKTIEFGGDSYTWINGVQVTDNIRELWKALSENGIDVWVCSASAVMPVIAAVDAFGLHDYCKGVVAMTMARDENGRYVGSYDFTDGYGFVTDGSEWKRDTIATRTVTAGPGKVVAIQNCIMPKYDGRGPLGCFMDSTGDFNFCTEFASTKLVVCFNRASRKVTDGGGLIAETAIYERDVLGYDLKKANEAGDILYVLQGRDENGLRTFRPSNETLRLGESEPKLFCNENNYTQYEYFKEKDMTVTEILNTFCVSTTADDPSNPFDFAYGFNDNYPSYDAQAAYPGYRSIK